MKYYYCYSDLRPYFHKGKVYLSRCVSENGDVFFFSDETGKPNTVYYWAVHKYFIPRTLKPIIWYKLKFLYV